MRNPDDMRAERLHNNRMIRLRGCDLIIGIAGRAGSGKSTAAGMVYDRIWELFDSAKEHLYLSVEVLPFAEPVKEIARDRFGWDGGKNAKGRALLVAIGTTAGRGYDPYIWVDEWCGRVKENRIKYVIADDVRFANEADTIRAAGGVIWHMMGRDGGVPQDDESERGISMDTERDYLVPNLQELGELRVSVTALLGIELCSRDLL